MSVFVDAFVTEASTRTSFSIHKGRFHRVDIAGNPDYSNDDFPFIVVRLGVDAEFSGDGSSDSTLADVVDATEVPLLVTYSGLTFDSVRILQTRTRAEMNRAKLTAPGWHCSRMVQSTRLAPTPDDSVTINRLSPWFAVDEYRFMATKET